MKYLFVYLLKFYRMLISPLFPPSCRFYPSCSSYAQRRLRNMGLGKGVGLVSGACQNAIPFIRAVSIPSPLHK